jgi:hypothetical protein
MLVCVVRCVVCCAVSKFQRGRFVPTNFASSVQQPYPQSFNTVDVCITLQHSTLVQLFFESTVDSLTRSIRRSRASLSHSP